MANLKDGTIVNGSVTGNLKGNADTASALYTNEIANNTNLNTLTSPGLYVANTTVINAPGDARRFTLKVDPMGDTHVCQTLFGIDAGASMYIRTYNGSSWSNWREIIAVDPN